MNKLEKIFYDTYERLVNEDDVDGDEALVAQFSLEEQVVIGIYKVDFVYCKCVIEIDGHEFHKTKEQREKDYKRERYLMRQGYTVIRFTGTEVFLDPKSCVREAVLLGNEINEREIALYLQGYDIGYSNGKCSN